MIVINSPFIKYLEIPGEEPKPEVLELTDTALYEKAKPITPERLQSNEFKKLINNMICTLNTKGGIGLAANQIGVNEQIFIVYEKLPDGTKQLYIMINAEIKGYTGGRKKMPERCLSFPSEKTISVKRYNGVIVNYVDENGELHKKTKFSGDIAQAIQHENGHNNGTTIYGGKK